MTHTYSIQKIFQCTTEPAILVQPSRHNISQQPLTMRIASGRARMSSSYSHQAIKCCCNEKVLPCSTFMVRLPLVVHELIMVHPCDITYRSCLNWFFCISFLLFVLRKPSFSLINQAATNHCQCGSPLHCLSVIFRGHGFLCMCNDVFDKI